MNLCFLGLPGHFRLSHAGNLLDHDCRISASFVMPVSISRQRSRYGGMGGMRYRPVTRLLYQQPRQDVNQFIDLIVGSDRDAQMIGDARQVEMTDQDAGLAQLLIECPS